MVQKANMLLLRIRDTGTAIYTISATSFRDTYSHPMHPLPPIPNFTIVYHRNHTTTTPSSAMPVQHVNPDLGTTHSAPFSRAPRIM